MRCSRIDEGDKPVDNARKHVGLQNDSGENNCFLNATVQALWHLDSFRNALINAHVSPNDVLLNAVQGLFIHYQYTELKIIPPTELRHALSFYDDSKFQLGEKADASEALEAILKGIHMDQTAPSSADSSVCTPQCVAHQVFGGMYLSQSRCRQCGASDEPFVDVSSFLLYTSVTALFNAHSPAVPRPSFGSLLHSSLSTPPRHCPSPPSFACPGTADTRTWCLAAPAVLALCVSWESASEEQHTIERFLGLMNGRISLGDVYHPDSLPSGGGSEGADGTTYLFRGFVCFYGRHYVSICECLHLVCWTASLLFINLNG
jgi:hypothetical protein